MNKTFEFSNAQEIEWLEHFQREVETYGSQDVLIEHLACQLRDLAKPFASIIYLLDESFDFFPVYCSKKEPEVFERALNLLVESGHFSRVLEQGKTLAFPMDKHVFQEEQSCCVLSPLKIKNKVFGMVCLYFREFPDKVPVKTIDFISRMIKITSKSLFFLELSEENEALKEENRFLKTYRDEVFYQVTDTLLILDFDLFIRDINRAGFKLLGLNKNNFQETSFNDFFDEDQKRIVKKVVNKVLEEKEIRNVELEIRNRYGEICPVSLSASLFQSGEQIQGIVVSLKDITEIRGLVSGLEKARVLIEEHNNSLEEKIRMRTRELKEKINEIEYLSEFNLNILQSMNSGVIGLNSSLVVNTFNQAASQITGIEEFEILGKNIELFSSLKKLSDFIKHALNSRMNINGTELMIKHINGKNVSLSASAAILYTPLKEVRGMMIVFADLTIIREMHQKVLDSERLAALGKMAASVAHEIRNPMNVIRGLAEVITKKEVSEEKINKYMSVVISQIDRLEFLLKEIVDFIKPRPPDLKEQDMNEIIEEVIDAFKVGFLHFAKKDILLEIDLNEIPPVPLDKDQFHQILFNLLKNSADAIEVTGNIWVKTYGEGAYVVLEVSDNGCGMEDNVQEHAFDAFFSTKMAKGTGLGLAIVKNIMESHNGVIHLESFLGKGTSIYLKFLKENDFN